MSCSVKSHSVFQWLVSWVRNFPAPVGKHLNELPPETQPDTPQILPLAAGNITVWTFRTLHSVQLGIHNLKTSTYLLCQALSRGDVVAEMISNGCLAHGVH